MTRTNRVQSKRLINGGGVTALSFAVDLNRGVDVVNPDKVVYDAEKYLKWLEK